LPRHEDQPNAVAGVDNLVWRNVLIAITPLSAAQIMLLIDRYLGGHSSILRPEAPLSSDALLLDIRHPEVYVLIIPCFAFMSEIIPVFSRNRSSDTR